MKTNVNLDKLTVSNFVNVDAVQVNPLKVLPGKQPLFWKTNEKKTKGDTNSTSSLDGVHSEWNKSSRANGRNCLLLLNRYGYHTQLSLIVQMRDDWVFIFPFPSYTFLVSQILDFLMLGPFKIFIQNAANTLLCVKSALNAFEFFHF